jgi:glutathione synthase/RimK-type ligase-like ATP-grasp enzyme
MRRIAFLTMDSLVGHISDDELACGPLRELGWEVETVPWRRPGVQWETFAAVVIRSTWDYHEDPEAFLALVAQIEQSGTHLENSPSLVRWNLKKFYLRDLERRGIHIVPTVWSSEIGPIDERAICARLKTDRVVLKPLISANATHTHRLTRGSRAWRHADVLFAGRPYLAQPFVASIVAEGEYSLMFFGGRFSHAILKTPEAQDFRVQEEHGGTVRAVTVAPATVEIGARIMAAVGEIPLYARVDLVRLAEGGLALMELELVEPSLYLRMDEGAARRFANAIHERACAAVRSEPG